MFIGLENRPDRKPWGHDDRLGVHDDRQDSWCGLGWLLPVKELLRTQISSGSLGLAGIHKALGLSGGEPSKHTDWVLWGSVGSVDNQLVKKKKRPSRDCVEWKVYGTADDVAWEVLHSGIRMSKLHTWNLEPLWAPKNPRIYFVLIQTYSKTSLEISFQFFSLVRTLKEPNNNFCDILQVGLVQIDFLWKKCLRWRTTQYLGAGSDHFGVVSWDEWVNIGCTSRRCGGQGEGCRGAECWLECDVFGWAVRPGVRGSPLHTGTHTVINYYFRK